VNDPALRERLDRLAESVPVGGATDGARLYRRSLRRRRRRAAATTTLVVVATAVVVVGGAAWLQGLGGAPHTRDGRPPVAGHTGDTKADAEARAELLAGVDDPGGRTAGQQVEVSRAEAERRCTTVWHQLWGPSDVTVQLGADSGPWFEGDAVEIANAQAFDYSPFDLSSTDGRCVIPQAGLEDTVGTVPLPLPAVDDADGIRAACGQYLGWDLSDWQVLVADRAGDAMTAMLRGPGGYVSRCQLDSWYLDDDGALDLDRLYADPHGGFVPFVEITPPEKFENETFGAYRLDALFLLGCHRPPPGQPQTACLGAGLVSGPEPVARVVVADAAGAEQEVPVEDGWYAFAGSVADGDVHVTVYAADDSVLAEYDASVRRR
jgi:hypothetical protein